MKYTLSLLLLLVPVWAWSASQSSYSTKTTPVSADKVLIVDSQDSWRTKNVLFSSFGKRQVSFVVDTPTDTDDFLLFKTSQAITITDIHAIVQGGTSISVAVQECSATGTSCVAVDSAITADADWAEDDGTLSNGTIDAGDWIKVVLGTPSGTVNFLTGSIYYNIAN